jgi:hypothetical protein
MLAAVTSTTADLQLNDVPVCGTKPGHHSPVLEIKNTTVGL